MEMIVNGIEVLFIVIGGSACRDVIPEGDIKPRKTTDIDMVLVPQDCLRGLSAHRLITGFSGIRTFYMLLRRDGTQR